MDWQYPPEIQRQEGETKKAYNAFLDYCQLGAGRSIDKLLAAYEANKDSIQPPTLFRSTIGKWSRRNRWQARKEVYDQWFKARIDQMQLDKRAEVIDEELADTDRLLAEWQKRWETAQATGALSAAQMSLMLKMRRDISDLRRRAVMLADKYTENKSEIIGDTLVQLKWPDAQSDD